MRHQAHPRAADRAYRALGSVLALPVFALVYAEAAGRRLRSVGPAGVVAGLVAWSLAGELVIGGQAAAVPPTAQQSLSPTAFRPVVVAAPDPATPAPVAPTFTAGGLGAAGGFEVAAGFNLPTATPLAPAGVVRFRPRSGQAGLARETQVSVRFTTSMDHASTRAAFRVTVNGKAVEGRYRWAEEDTVLVFTPAAPFPYGAKVQLSVAADARSSSGMVIRAARSVVFSVEPKPAPPPPAQRPAPAPTPRPQVTTAWRWPLRGPITQYFGQSLTVYGYHYGIDIDGSTGDPVRAARGGVVTVAGHWDSCGGIQVHIDHGGGFESWYRHLSGLDVKVGQHVAAGTVIGKVGATGCAFGSHLHFAIRHDGTFVNPMRYLPPR